MHKLYSEYYCSLSMLGENYFVFIHSFKWELIPLVEFCCSAISIWMVQISILWGVRGFRGNYKNPICKQNKKANEKWNIDSKRLLSLKILISCNFLKSIFSLFFYPKHGPNTCPTHKWICFSFQIAFKQLDYNSKCVKSVCQIYSFHEAAGAAAVVAP